jgi:hypothetical protein
MRANVCAPEHDHRGDCARDVHPVMFDNSIRHLNAVTATLRDSSCPFQKACTGGFIEVLVAVE